MSAPAWLDFALQQSWWCEGVFLNSSRDGISIQLPYSSRTAMDTNTLVHVFFRQWVLKSPKRWLCSYPCSLGFPSPSQYFTHRFGRQQLSHTGSGTKKRSGEGYLVQEFSTQAQTGSATAMPISAPGPLLPGVQPGSPGSHGGNCTAGNAQPVCSECSVLQEEALPVLKSCLIPLDENCTLWFISSSCAYSTPLWFFTVR